MVEWGLTGIDGLDDNTWPWWGRAQPRVELQAPKVFEAWVQSRNLSAEPEWNDLAVRTTLLCLADSLLITYAPFQPLSATFSRQPITSPAKLIPEERPTSPVILPENRSRMRQWLSFSATRPMPALPPPPPAAAPSPIQDVQIGVLLAMPFPPWKDKDSAKELEGLVMGFTRASWETPGSGDSEQKETTN